jgi:hypothetical protein
MEAHVPSRSRLPRQEEQGSQTWSGEKRRIVIAPRRRGLGSSSSRVVEVVHIRRSRSSSAEDRSPPAPRYVRAETWPEGFRAKSALPLPRHDMELVSPEPAQPSVHVMAMWEPSARQPAEPVTKPAEPPVVERRKPRISKPNTSKVTARPFANFFAEDDSGTNCIRCGYLVERARDKHGLMTCSQCG